MPRQKGLMDDHESSVLRSGECLPNKGDPQTSGLVGSGVRDES